VKRSLWAVDLDDTLVTSSSDYGQASCDATKIIMMALEHRAPRWIDIANFLEGINQSRLEEKRLMRDDFPSVLVESYRGLCNQVGINSDPTVEKQLFEIGYSALSEETYQKRQMIPGAEETLYFIRRPDNPLFCVTLGDSRVQWMKWRGYRLGRFFPTSREFLIVPKDKLETLIRLRLRYKDLPAFMVGDSIKSDLIPAHQAGFTSIYVPPPAIWDASEKTIELPPGTIKLSKISEIKERFDDLIRAD